MKVLRYRTNINCQACIRAVTGFLAEVPGIASWEVDTEREDKLLTVRGPELDARSVEEAVREAGFDLTPVGASA